MKTVTVARERYEYITGHLLETKLIGLSETPSLAYKLFTNVSTRLKGLSER